MTLVLLVILEMYQINDRVSWNLVSKPFSLDKQSRSRTIVLKIEFKTDQKIHLNLNSTSDWRGD